MVGRFGPLHCFYAMRKGLLRSVLLSMKILQKYTEFERVLQGKMQIPSDASTNASLGKGSVNDMLDYLIDRTDVNRKEYRADDERG